MTQYAAYNTNVLETLQFEHDNGLKEFERFKAASGVGRKQPFAVLKGLLRRHMEAEETIFYPVVTALGATEAALIATATTEHTAIKAAITAIESAGADVASGGQVTTLENALKPHIISERAKIFPAVRKKLTRAQRLNLSKLVGDKEKLSTLS